jgi:hypothetical protein
MSCDAAHLILAALPALFMSAAAASADPLFRLRRSDLARREARFADDARPSASLDVEGSTVSEILSLSKGRRAVMNNAG